MGKCLCPSDFDVPVTVCQASINPNTSGGQDVQFNPWFNSWAKVKLGARSEQFREDQLKGIKFYTLTMYYDQRIIDFEDNIAMMIDDVLWNIETADGLDGKKFYMEVVVKKGAGA
jgi:hypothetical protein